LFTALMDAFGTAAPDESATKPVSDPVMMPCAWDAVGWKKSSNKARLASDNVRHLLTNPGIG
jgi:hypothetical protein